MTAGLKHKLRSQKGETLIELLVSILIAALSVGMLMTGVTVSSRLNQAAQERDAVFYQLLTKAGRSLPASGFRRAAGHLRYR